MTSRRWISRGWNNRLHYVQNSPKYFWGIDKGFIIWWCTFSTAIVFKLHLDCVTKRMCDFFLKYVDMHLNEAVSEMLSDTLMFCTWIILHEWKYVFMLSKWNIWREFTFSLLQLEWSDWSIFVIHLKWSKSWSKKNFWR